MRKEKRSSLRRLLACLLVAVMMLTAIYPTFATEVEDSDTAPAEEVQLDAAESAADAGIVADGDLDAQEIASTASDADDAISTEPAAEETAGPAETDADEAAVPADDEMDANVTNDTADAETVDEAAPAADKADADAADETDAAAAAEDGEEASEAPADTPWAVDFTRVAPAVALASGPEKRMLKKAPACRRSAKRKIPFKTVSA